MSSYRIEITLAPGINFAVVSESVDDLLTEYEQIKGNRDWLVEQIMSMVPATEAGEGVGALSAAIAETLDNDTSSEEADRQERDAYEREAEKPVERVDPWSGKTVTEPARRRSAARTEPSRGSSAGASTGTSSNIRRERDRFGNQWTGGLPEAPNCTGHNEPSARFKGKSRAGNEYTVYKCARGAPWSDDWKSKCNFSEFPD